MNDFETKLRNYQVLFGLTNWKIILINSPVQVEDRRAKTLANPQYYTATVTVYPQLMNEPQVWDEIIIHELIHVVMALYDFYVDNMGTMTDITKSGVDELFFTARESSVSQITQIMLRLK